ncbi:MAG: peptide chain release factor 1 [Puniceicoccales bacterium]|jgi:peptide chain release factor 1|nr:peptide chain release factor 1 [Puniceicoccales bacterium]
MMSFVLPDIAPIRQRLKTVNLQLSDPETFKNNQLVSKLSREHQYLSKITSLYDDVLKIQQEQKDLEEILAHSAEEDLKALALQEKEQLAQRCQTTQRALRVAMIPPDPSDSRNTILEIRAGTGGEEAALFAGDLYRMYLRFAEEHGWKTELMGSHPSESGGFKEISFLISGDNVYKALKYESGGHRVQRVPITETNGRIHTSSATVAVLPEAQEVDIAIAPEDIEISVCRASGPGGQGVNTTDSAVQILHKPTGLIVTCADERSQQKNKLKALQVLRARLLKQKEDEEREKYAAFRKQQVGSGDRSDRIRTYNFTQNRVTDHRIGLTAYNLDRVLEGDLAAFIHALEQADQEEKLASFLTQNCQSST